MRWGSLSHLTDEETKVQRGEATSPKFTKLVNGKARTKTRSNQNDADNTRTGNTFLSIFG